MTEAANSLFNLIDFLHSKIKEFKKYDKVMNRLNELYEQRNSLYPYNNAQQKLEYDKVKAEIEEKENFINDKVGKIIQSKTDFDPCDKSGGSHPINIAHDLERNFNEKDIPTIKEKITKYIEYREQNKHDYCTGFFFNHLDETVTELYKFFVNDTEANPLTESEPEVTSDLHTFFNTTGGTVRLKLSNIQLQPNNTVENTSNETQTENDFRLSIIEDYLEKFKNKMSEINYNSLVQALKKYFESEPKTFPTLNKKIQIRGKINKKALGWALNRIFDYENMNVNIELMEFVKNISVFENVTFDKNNFTKSNLYKYLTTKTE